MGAIIGTLTREGAMSVGFSFLFYGIIMGFIAEPFRKGFVSILERKNPKNDTILDEYLTSEEQSKSQNIQIFSIPTWSNIYNNGSVIMGIYFIISLLFLFLFWGGVPQD